MLEDHVTAEMGFGGGGRELLRCVRGRKSQRWEIIRCISTHRNN